MLKKRLKIGSLTRGIGNVKYMNSKINGYDKKNIRLD